MSQYALFSSHYQLVAVNFRTFTQRQVKLTMYVMNYTWLFPPEQSDTDAAQVHNDAVQSSNFSLLRTPWRGEIWEWLSYLCVLINQWAAVRLSGLVRWVGNHINRTPHEDKIVQIVFRVATDQCIFFQTLWLEGVPITSVRYWSGWISWFN